jgi:hypothetical protein
MPPALQDAPLDPSSAALWAGLLFAWLAGSIAYRWKLGKPIFARAHASAAFTERWASARPGSGLVARLSTARNCMHVQVTANELRIHPHFPFTLGFMPELYDLDHVIPLTRVRAATILGGNAAKLVEVTYQAANGKEAIVHLLLRKGEAFVAAVFGGES